jgi:hypothetical protein
MEKRRRIKVIAIAKDEAAYIHEWVHHHIFFGFDGVEVIVNRTTDNSGIILEKLKAKHSQFDYLSCDWIDLCAPNISIKMQEIAYAEACRRAIDEGFTHVLLIDIDEYWTPLNFSSTIHDYLNSFPVDASHSFYWICELGQCAPFAPISDKLNYFTSTHLKTLSRVDRLKEVRIHTPAFIEGAIHLMADGSLFSAKPNAPQFHDSGLGSLNDAFIIHRLYRSETEYLALLFRGNPDSKTRGENDFKLNRHGYNFNQGVNEEVVFPTAMVESYRASLDVFILQTDIARDLELARGSVELRAQACIDAALSLENTKIRILRQLFDGCKNKDLVALLNDSRKVEANLDVVKEKDGVLLLSGWAGVKHAMRDLTFSILSPDDLSLSWNRSNRLDVNRAFPWAPSKSGFDLRISKKEGYSGTIFDIIPGKAELEIKEADLIKVFHNSFLFYDTDQQMLRHGRIVDLRSKSWMVPVFFTSMGGRQVLAIYLANQILVIGLNEGKLKGLPIENVTSNFRIFAKEPLDGDVFAIRHGECYAGTAPGGDVYYNRVKVQDWEKFEAYADPDCARLVIPFSAPSN